jgi:hypothetical protein
MQMQQPRRQWCGRGRNSRACQSSRAEKKGDGDIKVQATDAARQGPAQALRSWRGAWKSAPPRVGDDGS